MLCHSRMRHPGVWHSGMMKKIGILLLWRRRWPLLLLSSPIRTILEMAWRTILEIAWRWRKPMVRRRRIETLWTHGMVLVSIKHRWLIVWVKARMPVTTKLWRRLIRKIAGEWPSFVSHMRWRKSTILVVRMKRWPIRSLMMHLWVEVGWRRAEIVRWKLVVRWKRWTCLLQSLLWHSNQIDEQYLALIVPMKTIWRRHVGTWRSTFPLIAEHSGDVAVKNYSMVCSEVLNSVVPPARSHGPGGRNASAAAAADARACAGLPRSPLMTLGAAAPAGPGPAPGSPGHCQSESARRESRSPNRDHGGRRRRLRAGPQLDAAGGPGARSERPQWQWLALVSGTIGIN